MAYCTVYDIGRYAQHVVIDESSDPSRAEVELMIASTDAVMDQKFKAVGITVPVTDSALLEVVKPISVHGVLAKVLRSLEMESVQAREYQRLHDDAMKEIMNRPAILATSTAAIAMPTGSDRNDEDPPFERGVDAW